MDITAYAAEAATEQTHWWFVVRRRLFARLIDEFGVDRAAPVLDVGTSTGTNLRMLKEMGFRQVSGLDRSPEAIRFCAEKGLGPVHRGDACDLPFPDASQQLVLATDIIEHVEDDDRALAELHRVLRPGGLVILTVPAFESLWGLQDQISHHQRRYRYRPLLEKIRRSGFRVVEGFHFNFLLFFPVWAARQGIRLLRIQVASENDVNAPWLNRLLTGIFGLDVRAARWLRPPFGVSILMVLTHAGD